MIGTLTGTRVPFVPRRDVNTSGTCKLRSAHSRKSRFGV